MILAFTGAGISKASGIPTFEEQEGEAIRDKLTRSFANRNPEEYNNVIQRMYKTCEAAKPNDAHMALAEYKVPVITMNVDQLHQRAGSEYVLELHGHLPDTIVLYEDPAPNYGVAYDLVERLHEGDILLIVGTSFYTTVSESLRILARSAGARIVLINEDAEHRVREFLEEQKRKIEDIQTLLNRE